MPQLLTEQRSLAIQRVVSGDTGSETFQSMIKFSVITITYNAEKVIQRTLNSVLQQTYEDVEHLIIDGASKDGTLALAENYKQQSDEGGCGHKVIIKSEPDQGIYDAMNKGLTQASGDYVVFMNAGDFFPASDTLEQIVHHCHLKEQPSAELPAVLYGNTNIVDDKGNYLHPRRLQPPPKLSWRSFKKGMLVCHQAFYARTDIAKNLQYDTRYKYSADVDWCIRVMREGERMGLPLYNINMVVANYTEEGATTRHHRESLRERYKVMANHYGQVSTFLMHCWFAVRSVFKK
jgi:glycosyltransferase involved in cell wall biosynthesis